MDTNQKCGSEAASAFGGSGNNTNAAAGSCNGNNSVANSDTNYGPGFACCYNQNDSNIASDNMTNKVEHIATTADSKKAAVSESRASSEMESGNKAQQSLEESSSDDNECGLEPVCMEHPAEIGKKSHYKTAIKTLCTHKRLRNVKAFLLNKDVIRAAIYEAMENKKVTPQLTWIKHHIPETVERIYNELKNETYEPQCYRFRTIKNKEEKPRHLAILGFYDRCVQQLLKNVIQEKLRAIEPRNVYSNLPKRGTLSNTAKYCLYGQLRHDFKIFKDGYGLIMDIHHCYESISAEVVMRELFKYLTDSFARRLVKRMFKHISYLPIGDPLSGLYVNLVLRQWHIFLLENRHELFDRCYFFCDDALFINRNSKKALHLLCQESRRWLVNYAGLHIKGNYSVSRLSEGITFCGVRAFPDRLRIKQLTKKRMLKNQKNPRSLASYKGILDKTSSAHLAKMVNMHNVSERVKIYNQIHK